MKKSKLFLFALLPFVVIVFIFEILPLATILYRSITTSDGGFTMQHFIDAFSKELYSKSIINSITISLISVVIGIVVAFFGAKSASSSSSRTKRIFTSILNITSNFAGIPLAFAFIILFGNVGIFTLIGETYGISFLADFDLYSTNGVLLTYVYFQIPLATLLLMPAFAGLKKQWKESVKLLGGNEFIYWVKVALPCLLPSILGTVSVLFANAIAAYATAYALLSGNAMFLPIRISEQFTGDIVQNPNFGSALAVILMLLMVVMTQLTTRISKRSRGVK